MCLCAFTHERYAHGHNRTIFSTTLANGTQVTDLYQKVFGPNVASYLLTFTSFVFVFSSKLYINIIFFVQLQLALINSNSDAWIEIHLHFIFILP